MDNNRSDILAQLASGQITVDQAAEQLRGTATGSVAADAAGAGSTAAGQAADEAPSRPPVPPVPPAPPIAEKSAKLAGRWLRVRVSDLESGRQRVSVNLPLSWVAMGLRIGARYSPEVAALDPDELLSTLQSGATGQMVDVEDLDDGQRVQIFIE